MPKCTCIHWHILFVLRGRDYDKLISDSYKALYFAKKSGKNHIDVYDSGRRNSVTPKTAVEHDLNTIADIISNENDYNTETSLFRLTERPCRVC